jgi:hypothetical protein
MHIHNVYFWLKDSVDAQASAAFEQGLKQLSTDPLIQHSHYGRPADTHRDVVENTYSYGLVFVFADKVTHDRYQEGEVHHQFLADHLDKWDRVSVFDIESK